MTARTCRRLARHHMNIKSFPSSRFFAVRTQMHANVVPDHIPKRYRCLVVSVRMQHRTMRSHNLEGLRSVPHSFLLPTTIILMTRLKFPKISLTPIAVLDGTVASLEATKDAITAAAPVPGLSIALNVLIALLKKLQVRNSIDVKAM